jgi:hypothetical protein
MIFTRTIILTEKGGIVAARFAGTVDLDDVTRFTKHIASVAHSVKSQLLVVGGKPAGASHPNVTAGITALWPVARNIAWTNNLHFYVLTGGRNSNMAADILTAPLGINVTLLSNLDDVLPHLREHGYNDQHLLQIKGFINSSED